MKKLSLLAVVAVLLLIPTLSQAQVPLTTPLNVTLNASLAETLSVTLTGVSTVNFTLAPGAAAAGDNPVGIQSSWVLKPGKTEVKVVGYFDTTNALTDTADPTNHIASSTVFGRVAPGSFTAFTGTVLGIGTTGASLLLVDELITGGNKNKTRTDSLDLQIDLTGAPQQPAGTYAGVLHIRGIVL
jgi:hypothetical protein